MEQYHLTGRRHSGRAIRVESLDDIAVADNLTAAAKMMGADAIYPELKKREWAIGIKQFIREMSEPCTDPLDPKVKWKKMDVSCYDEGLAKYFTVKDVLTIEAIYREYHDVTKDELDAITGKAIQVSAG